MSPRSSTSMSIYSWPLTSNVASKLTACLSSPIAKFVEDKVHLIKGLLEENGILAPEAGDTSSESQAVVEARNALASSQGTLRELQNNLKNHKEDLEKDYGPASIFRALKDKCVSKDSGEYAYEHCFLSKTKQNPKKGGASALMGNFVGFGTVGVDEVDESGEIVPVAKMTLEYANGQKCWNGPTRSTTVILECGEKDEIVKVMEDAKCVYSMIVNTPAVCEGGEAEGNVAPRQKDEL